MSNHSSASAAPTTHVLLLQPARVGGKNHPEGTVLKLTQRQADSLCASGSASLTDPDSEQPAPSGEADSEQPAPSGEAMGKRTASAKAKVSDQ